MSKKWTVASFVLLLLVLVGTIMTAIAILKSDRSQQAAPATNNRPEADKGEQAASEAAPESGMVTVTYTDKGFSPASVTVVKGTTLNFDNQTEIPMWTASDPHPDHTNYPEFDVIRTNNGAYPEAGNDFSFTFDRAGTWTYHNHTMPAHTASITVK